MLEIETNENEILLKKLQDIKDQEGIMGYILRNKKSASIDLKDPTKLIEYAILSSKVQEVGQNMIETMQLGELDNIVLESENKKVLYKNINDQRVTIFMEKNTNHSKVCKNLK